VSPYEYLTVFVSVVLGLAIVHLLSGVALLFDARVRAQPDWIHAIWTANVLATTVLVWWFNFSLTHTRSFPLAYQRRWARTADVHRLTTKAGYSYYRDETQNAKCYRELAYIEWLMIKPPS